ncbi:hypothetical protein BOW53_13925 [Solemya pervernicosa gill symbiont]|uniref:Uncharacterized protein n=1 Tax=Solemya pervernicosa gill symbiont TaxID=642797 RepID=A0A1T2L1G0_9GAMM|nr:hypothetical protein BOW53_13925 [Solemya pervernicosa gill symbiont]
MVDLIDKQLLLESPPNPWAMSTFSGFPGAITNVFISIPESEPLSQPWLALRMVVSAGRAES